MGKKPSSIRDVLNGRATAAFILFLLASGCTSPLPSANRQRRPWTDVSPDGLEILTEHFDIRTTARDTVLREALPNFLEAAFAQYRRLLPPAGSSSLRLPIYLFDTRDQWARFTLRFAPDQAYTYLHIHAGGYTDYRTSTAVTFDLGRDRTLSLLAHEGFHQYAANYRTLPLPSWLNEGLACQFEAFSLAGDRPTFTPRVNLIRMAALREALTRENGLAPISELLRTDAGRAIRQAGPSAPIYYAQLWSTVLYLGDESCPYAPGFRSLLADAGTPRLAAAIRAYRAAAPASAGLSDAEAVFHHYITSDPEAFAAKYRAFVEKLVY